MTTATTLYTADALILAPPASGPGQAAPITPAAVAAIIAARPNGQYVPIDILTIVRGYADTCAAAGVDPYLVLAQLLHETAWLDSWWSQRPRRNPAGIGVTGRHWRGMPPVRSISVAERDGIWYEGVSFASWTAHAIPAHVGRLLAYALPPNAGTAVQQRLVRVALVVRPLPASHRGAAPTLRGLGGRWAVPGQGYADKIADIANTLRGVE